MICSTISHCRICRSDRLRSIVQLGTHALTGVFPRSPSEPVPVGPLELVRCDAANGCGLIQLRHSYAPERLYGDNYGYRSGLNRSMIEHLRRRIAKAVALARPKRDDLVIDIGSNDATALRAYPDGGLIRTGIDPTGPKFARYYPPHINLIPEFFSAAAIERWHPGSKAKIVTSFAMFYDLDDPLDFMRQVRRILADDGVWIFEQSYAPAMIEQLAYDTICHEHLCYYALKQIKWLTDRAGLRIIDVETNPVNGGSFCVTVAKNQSPYPEATEAVARLLAAEDSAGFEYPGTFERFRARVVEHGERLRETVQRYRRSGHTIYGYGASTKGNVLLQYCGLGPDDLPAIAEVNEDKFGAVTPGTHIPIWCEAEVRARRPDALLVLPWHFRDSIIERERTYLEDGGTLLFPLPAVTVHRSAGSAPLRKAPASRLHVEGHAS